MATKKVLRAAVKKVAAKKAEKEPLYFVTIGDSDRATVHRSEQEALQEIAWLACENDFEDILVYAVDAEAVMPVEREYRIFKEDK